MPLIHIKTNRLEYKFEISGKYTVIQGDSATGKTTFYDLVYAMYNEPRLAQNISGIKLVPIERNADESTLSKFSGVVFVMDEFCSLFKKKNIATLFKESNNYFIVIIRDEKDLDNLQISDSNILNMKVIDKVYTLERRVI